MLIYGGLLSCVGLGIALSARRRSLGWTVVGRRRRVAVAVGVVLIYVRSRMRGRRT